MKDQDKKIIEAFTEKNWNEIKTNDSWVIFKVMSEFVEAFEKLLDEFMTSRGVLVLIKLGKRWRWVEEVLIRKKLLDNTIFVKKLGFPDQVVVQAKDFNSENVPYFSLLIIRKSLILEGDIKYVET